MVEDRNQDYLTGELRGDVNAILRKLDEIENKIDGTHTTHDENYRRLEERIRKLEKFRAWFYGSCGVVAGLATVVATAARVAGAI